MSVSVSNGIASLRFNKKVAVHGKQRAAACRPCIRSVRPRHVRVAAGGVWGWDDADATFDAMDRMMAQQMRMMERMQRDLDADIARMNSNVDDMVARAERLAERGELAADSAVRQYRSEQSGPGYWRKETFTIIDGTPRATMVPHSTTTASPLSALWLGAALVFGGYMAATVAFWRNYGVTSFTSSNIAVRVLLTVGWPVLCLLSARYREQFWRAVRYQPSLPTGTDSGSVGSP